MLSPEQICLSLFALYVGTKLTSNPRVKHFAENGCPASDQPSLTSKVCHMYNLSIKQIQTAIFCKKKKSV